MSTHPQRQIDDLWAKFIENLKEGEYENAYQLLLTLDRDFSEEFEPGILEFRLGHCCYHTRDEKPERFDMALDHFLRAKSLLDPVENEYELMRVLDFLGVCYWIKSDLEAARLHLEEGLTHIQMYHQFDSPALRHDEYDFYILLAEVYLIMDRYSDARRILDLAKPLLPELPDPAAFASDLDYRLGRAEHYLNNNANALRILKRVNPEHLDRKSLRSYHFTFLRIYIAERNYSLALQHHGLLTEMGPEPKLKAIAHYMAGVAYFHLNQLKAARREFECALSEPDKTTWLHRECHEYLTRIIGDLPTIH
jgi:tetratricopeptide (TPR) repeat protein